MYLHVGNEMILNEKDIIGVFDIENASISKFTKEFLSRSQKAGRISSTGWAAMSRCSPT